MIKRRSLIENKKAEFTPATFVIIVIALIIIAPIILKVINSATGGLIDAVNGTMPAAALEGQRAVEKVTGFFDYLVIIGVLVVLILLFVSSFFIDTHPIFIIIYIMAALVLILIMPNVLEAIDTIWGQFPTETGQLPFTDFLRNNFIAFIVGIIVVTGIIMYAKFRSTRDNW